MQFDRVRRTALAVAVLTVIGAIAALAGTSLSLVPAQASADSASLLGTDGGTATGATGATGASAPTGLTGATGATSTGAGTGTTGTTGSTGAASTGADGGTTGAGTTPAATTPSTTGVSGPSGTSGATGPSGGLAGVGSPAAGAGATGGTAAPVIATSLPQPQSGSGAKHSPSHGSSAARGTGSASGPTAPSPALFGGSNPLAGVLPGSWDDPFIVNGAAEVPAFYVENFHIPPFLLPIYEAAGAAYGIPWQALAAINEVETDYGTNLDTSSAGAIGWMQFLPSTWRRYGVDASGSGARDPYNAADAIFAAARYLAAAGATHNLPGAIFAYNHSHAYVQSVLLRAELLSGEPSALLRSVSELAEGDFPIQLRDHASYAAVGPRAAAPSGAGSAAGSAAAPSPSAVGAAAASAARAVPATIIFAASRAAVVAAQDATVVAIGHNHTLGRYVVLRNAFGDRFTYGNLASVSAFYPRPRVPAPSSALLSTAAPAALAPGPHPTAPASAGAQRSGAPLSRKLFHRAAATAAATAGSPPAVATIDLRSRPSVATLFTPLTVLERAARVKLARSRHGLLASYYTGAFGLRPSQLELARLRVGSHLLAGTILGRLAHTTRGRRAHLVFELRPTGVGQQPIDPRPFLDAWSQLETLELHRDSLNPPFYGPNLHPASVGTLLLSSQTDIERIVLQDTRVTLPACERTAIAAGNVDRRVLATLEVLVVHGIDPTVSGAWCSSSRHRSGVPAILKTANAVALSALGGQPAASVAGVAVKALAALRGAARPALSEQTVPGEIVISFGLAHQPQALAAAASYTGGFALSPLRWAELDTRLGQIREPRVPTAVSTAALASHPRHHASRSAH